jgi:hypothetical protein
VCALHFARNTNRNRPFQAMRGETNNEKTADYRDGTPDVAGKKPNI